MTQDLQKVWAACMIHFKKSVAQADYNKWFVPIQPHALENQELTISIPDKNFYTWIEENALDIMSKTLQDVVGPNAKLKYRLSRSISSQPQEHSGAEEITEPISPFVYPGLKKPVIPSNLNPKYTFDNFIEGDCNKMARAAGKSIAESPGTTAFNPLFIYGDTGLGKTHLAHAIGNGIRRNHGDKYNVYYVTAEDFINQYVESLKNNALNDFSRFYKLVDMLIVDDIQFLSNKKKIQETFFHIFNQLHREGKQLVLTSDRSPIDLAGITERLISRFKWGLSADIGTPEYETRLAIMSAKMDEHKIDISTDVAEFIAYNVKSNIRELEGVLVSLAAQQSLNDKDIDLDLAKEVIKRYVNVVTKEITVDFIKLLVADYFGVEVEKLHGKTRKRQIVLARQISIFLARQFTNKPLKTIGSHFGGRDHSTIIYSLRAVQDLIDTNQSEKHDIEELERKIKLSLNEK